MRIVCIGGGPAGLYFALLMKQQDPAHRVTRRRAQPALRHVRLGRGVLRPDARQPAGWPTRQTAAADPATPSTTGTTSRSSFKGAQHRARAATASVGIGRKRLLNILQARCEELGVELVFETDVEVGDADYPDADLIIASDGLNTAIRAPLRRAPSSPTSIMRPNRFVWLGTTEAVRRLHLRLPADRARLVPGARLPVRRDTSTFIVETHRGSLARRTASTRWTRRSRSPSARSCSPRCCDGAPADDQCAPPARLGLAQFPRAHLRHAGAASQRQAATSC